MSSTVVDSLHAQFSDLVNLLDRAGEISLRALADDSFRKSLLLCAASHFENELTKSLIAFVEEVSNSNLLLTSFLRNKVISRQYHTWFKWEDNNANQFFGLFGSEFRDYMKERVKAEDDLDESIRAFLDVRRERNRLVHQDYGTFTLEKTADEIYQRYGQAKTFVDRFPTVLYESSWEIGWTLQLPLRRHHLLNSDKQVEKPNVCLANYYMHGHACICQTRL